MGAVVDVCWGKYVKERMLVTRWLEPLQLWGDFQGVTIWLEWEKTIHSSGSDHLIRFVVFVQHPEAMLYANKQTVGKRQD
jgi:hypothetical protein